MTSSTDPEAEAARTVLANDFYGHVLEGMDADAASIFGIKILVRGDEMNAEEGATECPGDSSNRQDSA